MRLVSVVLILFLMATAAGSDSATKKCIQAEAAQAEKEADALKDQWIAKEAEEFIPRAKTALAKMLAGLGEI